MGTKVNFFPAQAPKKKIREKTHFLRKSRKIGVEVGEIH